MRRLLPRPRRVRRRLRPTHARRLPPSRRTSATISPSGMNRSVVSFGLPGTARVCHGVVGQTVDATNERETPLIGAGRRVVADAVGAALVPGHAPQPLALAEHTLRRAPRRAVGREGDARLPAHEAPALVDRAAGDDHQSVVRRDRQLRIAQVDACLAHERRRRPGLTVVRHEHADAAVAADVVVAFAERAVPAAAPADQVGEGVVRAGIPDARDADEPGWGWWLDEERHRECYRKEADGDHVE